ncbi:MAG: oxidoreductase [Rhodospirillaceae bacterium TMED63]|nr:oxidoreductase [Rhodospirillaceae bacterium]RPF95806.1 MAG: oxidoreductase [Rhodospirillaceae bacterium TMED63]
MNTQPAPIQTPDVVSAVAAARTLAPTLRDRADETDALRCLPEENVSDMKDAGLFRVIQPARCGGWQMDFHAHLDVVEEISAGCGASGWCLGILQIHSWVAGLLSQQAQDDIYGADQDALIVAVLNARGEAVPGGDGCRVSGFWPFGSGSEHSQWAILGARVLGDDGEVVDEGCFLIPMAEIEIKDDWRVVGLRGTGSCSLVAKNVDVPAHRFISFIDGRVGKTPGGHLHDGTLYKAPLAPSLAIALCGPAVGIAEGAINDFIGYVPGRTNPQLRGAAQIDSPLTHQTVAEAKAQVDAARMLLHRAADDIHEAAEHGGEMLVEIRARIRMDSAYAVRLCMEAGEAMFLASGGSGLAESNPVQRAWRDLHAINQHALLQLPTNAEIYGRIILGLDPGSDIL